MVQGKDIIFRREMKYIIRISAVFIFAAALLSGCVTTQGGYVRQPYGGAATFSGSQYVPLKEFCDTYNISCSIDKVSSIAEVKYNGNVVKIMPNSNISLINDSVKRIYPQPVMKDDSIYVPASFLKYLEDMLKKKITVPYVEKHLINRIVIDPGHGGNNIGAVGKHYGVREKELNLDVAKMLKEELLKLGNFDIKLTRTSDAFIPLEERADIANRFKTDLFISIHANTVYKRHIKGLEIFYISERTNDYSRAVRAAENEAKSDTSGSNNSAAYWKAKLRENRKESKELAKMICINAVKDLNLRNRGVKASHFLVLKRTNMPAVLVEMGFLSNKQEEERLKSYSYRRSIARTIAEGILLYRDKYEKAKGYNNSSN